MPGTLCQRIPNSSLVQRRENGKFVNLGMRKNIVNEVFGPRSSTLWRGDGADGKIQCCMVLGNGVDYFLAAWVSTMATLVKASNWLDVYFERINTLLSCPLWYFFHFGRSLTIQLTDHSFFLIFFIIIIIVINVVINYNLIQLISNILFTYV